VIIGASYDTSGYSRAFKYSGSTMTDLGTLLGGSSSYANGVSADGNVIVGSSYDNSSGYSRAFKYSGSTMTDLGTLGGSSSYVRGVSADGSVIVGSSYDISGNYRAFKYSGSTMTDLGTLGSFNSFVSGVSADGSVIVGYSYNNISNNYLPFKYSESTLTYLGILEDSPYVSGVSADGSVIVGGFSDTSGYSHAFKYSESLNLGISQDQLQSFDNILPNISNADFAFNFTTNNLGSNISDSNFYSIANSLWGDGETIHYSSSLLVGGTAGTAIIGTAAIDQSTGTATFAANDDTLAEQIAAIERSFANGGHAAGEYAEWTNAGNTYLLIDDGFASSEANGVSAGDTLIQLVGVDVSQVSLNNGHLVYQA
jgi:probable HAF family extracellular repeat protein